MVGSTTSAETSETSVPCDESDTSLTSDILYSCTPMALFKITL